MKFSRESWRLLCHSDKEVSPGEHSLCLVLLLRGNPLSVLKHMYRRTRYTSGSK